MHKRILLMLTAALLLAQACKKKADLQPDPPDPGTMDSIRITSYPVSYRFAEAGNLSGMLTYDSTGIVHAPNHRATTIPYLVNLQDSLLGQVDRGYAGEVVTLLGPSRMRIAYQSQEDTLGYTRSGNRLVLRDVTNSAYEPVYFVLSGSELRQPESVYGYMVFPTGQTITGGGICADDPYAFFRYYAYSRYGPNYNDTIAVRNFDLIYRTQ